jgi:acetate kinase
VSLLVVNVGSSSLKLSAVDDRGTLLASDDVIEWDGRGEVIGDFADRVGSIERVGHRVVHGGPDFTGPVVIDDHIEAQLAGLVPLAPLHQPRAIAAIRAARMALPAATHVACFDTAFHATMAPAAHVYALPQEWRDRWPLRRFGFHGLSHAYAARRAAELAGVEPSEMHVVTCHLGAGASLCAVRGGRSVDTTMGFTPLEGLVMATRSGTIDPGLVVWLLQHGEVEIADLARALDSDSGLAGLSGIAGGDLRAVLAARADQDAASELAFAVYVHRLRRELGGMIAVLGGIDVLVFTGGVGERSHEVRAAACETLGYAGIAVDPARNDAVVGEGEIGTAGSGVRVLVVPAREDIEIARQVRAIVGSGAS